MRIQEEGQTEKPRKKRFHRTKAHWSKTLMGSNDHRYTPEEDSWLIFIRQWRDNENHGLWPTMTQTLALAKKFLGIAVIIAGCSVIKPVPPKPPTPVEIMKQKQIDWQKMYKDQGGIVIEGSK